MQASAWFGVFVYGVLMSDLKQVELSSLARRHFLGISAAVAGRIAGGAAVGLPLVASISARADDGNDRGGPRRHDDGGDYHPPEGGGDGRGEYHPPGGTGGTHYNCFLRGTGILTPRGE